jgi:hypothetical protein
MNTDDFLRGYLLYFVLPLWLLAGIADWSCHRATRIEATSGTKESFIHLLMMGEAGVCVLMGLFLEITGLVLLVMVGAWVAHEATSFWDVSYAHGRRYVGPIEQRVHDYMGVVPLLALSIVLALHWPQALAWFGAGPEPLRLSLELKNDPLPIAYVVALLGGILLLSIIPFMEEFLRCLRSGAKRPAPELK